MKSVLSIRTLFLLLLFVVPTMDNYGQTFSFKTRDESKMMTARQLKEHAGADTIIVRQSKWDEMVASGASWANNMKFKSVHAFVRFSVEHRYPVKIITPYTFRLTYKVYGYNNMVDTNAYTSFIDTLTISYNPDSLSSFQDMQYKKYSNFHKIMIVTGDMYAISGASSTPVLVDMSPAGSFDKFNFNLEGAIQVQPYHKRARNGAGYEVVYGGTQSFKLESATPVNDYMPVRWNLSNNNINGVLELTPANYELEWAYVDNYKMNADGSYTTKSASQSNYNFKDNSTRVWLDTNYYQIPMIYQKGFLVYRVRLVRPDSTFYRYPIYSNWSLPENGTVYSAGAANYRELTGAHMNDSLNWQYTVSFAEQGKYKQVMSYYDGMLKNRQSITRFNSMPNKLIATEQVYDYEGRPSISILPTPIPSSNFRYQYNLSLNAYSGLPYRAADFDYLSLSVCPLDSVIAPLGTGSPANIYYSATNPDKVGFQKFVPDAGGYPLVQTVYSPGYDERVEKQGGAGDSLQIGYKHNVKNDYVSADQLDLNRLFGLNIGWSGFYRKTVSRDPNGQLSLNVSDYRGKTMTSSMIGIPDTTIHALRANENLADTAFYMEEHIAGTTQQVMGNKRILDKNFFNDAGGNNLSWYVYNFTPFQTFCPSKYLSVKARYDYSIFDECGALRVDTGGTLGITGVLNSGTVTPFISPQISFFMEKGKHSLHKELTVNTDEIALAVDQFMNLSPAENCLKTEPWFIKESVLSKQYPCPEDNNFACGVDCGAKKYQMMEELWPNKDSVYIKRKYGIHDKETGLVIGSDNSIFTLLCGYGPNSDDWNIAIGQEDIRSVIGGTTTWEGNGPYVINPGVFGPGIMDGGFVLNGTDTLHCKYRYQDTCLVHLPTSATRFGQTYSGLQTLPVDTFIYVFNDSIAEALLPLHPEYCSLLECVDDVYEKRIRKIPDAKVANALGMLRLSELIAADPLYAQMQTMPTVYPNPYDTLAFSVKGIMSLDTMALIHAYCNCLDSIMLNECYTNMFAGPISGGLLINDYVAERYFDMITSLYIGNRKRYLFNLNPATSALGGCSTCQEVRMELVPLPIFMDVFDPSSPNATGPGSFLGSVNSIAGPGAANAASILYDYTTLVNVIPQDTLWLDSATIANYSDSATTLYNAAAQSLCMGAIDHIMQQLVNCADAPALLGVRNSLEALCIQGQVMTAGYTPIQIRKALTDNGIPLGDLCNPYLVNYDGNMALPAGNTEGAFMCNSDGYYADASATFTGDVLNALKNTGISYTIPLNAANQFQAGLMAELGNASSCSVLATFDYPSHLYTLTFSNGGQNVKMFFKTAESGTCAQAFTPLPNDNITVAIDCVNNAFYGFANGYVGKYSFVAVVSHTVGNNTTHCKLPSWNDKVAMNNEGENPIADCVPCTQMMDLYRDFSDTLSAYEVKGVDHPYYNTMLRNFMNFKLKKAFIDQQYLTFMESCALADSLRMKRYVGYYYLNFNSSANVDSFFAFVNSIDPSVVVEPAFRVQYSAGTSEVGIDFNQIPKSKLRQYRLLINSYILSHSPSQINDHYINNTISSGHGPNYMGLLLVPVNSPFNPATVSYPSDPFNAVFYQNVGLWNGNSFDQMKLYSVFSTNPLNEISNSFNTQYLIDYLYTNNIPGLFYNAIAPMQSAQDVLDEKQAYLNYTYNYHSLPPNKVLDSLQTEFLNAGIGTFGNKLLSYGHPAAPGNIQNLYIGDPATATNGTRFDKLSFVLTTVRNHFINTLGKNTIFFTGPNTIQILPNNKLTAYRCGDTAFWYRHFGEGDTMYNVFVRVPGYLDTSVLPDFTLEDFGFNMGEGNSRSFYVNVKNVNLPLLPLRLDGYTDFTVAKNLQLNDVLLTHPIMDTYPLADTVDNCERQTLKLAIFEGKVRYKNYIDSIRERLESDFFVHVMGQGVTEQLFVGYKNQRFNYTLYYYDRAGNLMRTVPPAGVNMLNNNQLLSVNDNRLANQNPTSLFPLHLKPSEYKYNTLNQVVKQTTPDGGKTDYFYDAAGRVIFSQNDKQRYKGNMTYTLYDKQGRIMETGQAKIACTYFDPIPSSAPGTGGYACSYYDAENAQITPFPVVVHRLKQISHDEVVQYVHALSRDEVVLTHYDEAIINLPTEAQGLSAQDNLRKRVSSIKYFDALQPTDTLFKRYTYAMHFSYDIAGNVKTLTRDYPAWKPTGQQFKRMDYDYDVISGKVNLLSYNRGYPDQYFQRYGYDADNRITKVETSSDAYIWKRDAEYQYYQHGPLARMSLGDLRVQGVDYAYTIQGWLKAINGDQLDTAKDMGMDATSNSVVANDAVALTLDYFKGDYKPIGTTAVTHLRAPTKNLYNGNIPRATTAILPFPDLAASYTYDQLNRIVRADYDNMSRYDTTLTNTANYYSSYAYDPDGNLKKLVRNGNKTSTLKMDSLIYRYTNNAINDNKLQNVNDYAANNYQNDIKNNVNQYVSRYLYDATGNVIKDQVSGQDTIIWNHYNKVVQTRNDSLDNGLEFAYDGAGNRYLKTVTKSNGDTTLQQSDYYVRDAQGNILAVYNAQNKYVMTQQQWVEYVTTQFIALCHHNNYVREFVVPYYGQNRYFKTTALQQALADGWGQGQLALSPVSFFVLNNNAAMDNTLSGVTDYGNFYTDMATYSLGQNTNILGEALATNINNSLQKGSDENTKLLSSLFHPNNGISTDLFGLLCSKAPSILQQMMADYGLNYQSTCNDNVAVLKDYFKNPGKNLPSFLMSANTIGINNYFAQYQTYLQSLYAPSTSWQGSDGSSNTSLELLCITAPDLLEQVMRNMNIESYDQSCPDKIISLNNYFAADPTKLPLFAEKLANTGNESFPDAYGDYVTQLSSNNSIVDMDNTQQHLFEMLCGYAPEVIEKVMGNVGLSFDAGQCDSNATALKDFYTNNPEQMEGLLSTIHEKANEQQDYWLAYLDFVKAVAIDTVVLKNPGFTGTNGTLIAQLQQSLLDYGDRASIGGFLDNWAPARDLMESTNDPYNLLSIKYDADAATFINDYTAHIGGSPTMVNNALTAISGLTLSDFMHTLEQVQTSQYCLYTSVQAIVHSTYENALKYQRLNLAEHHLYGSSRLGTKSYLPNQYYLLWDHEGPTPIVDTINLTGRRAWYSNEYNDGISGLATLPYGMTDVSPYYVQHTIGQKQYELSNHLGNVQATVTDLPAYSTGAEYTSENTDTIRLRSPAIAAAYDYYPFGMLMPDRYVSDTSSKCITVTQTKWVTTMVDSCYDVYKWVWPYYEFLKTTVLAYPGNGFVQFNMSSDNSFVAFQFAVVPSMNNIIKFELADGVLPRNTRAEVLEEVNGEWVILTSRELKDRITSIRINPSQASVKIKIYGPGLVKVKSICVKVPKLSQENLLVDVCDDDKDRYRFGFNGQEKVNEWAGVGNFMDYKERGQDTRIARFLSTDALTEEFPWYTPYQFAGNDPIRHIDLDGLEPALAVDPKYYLYQGGGEISEAMGDIVDKLSASVEGGISFFRKLFDNGTVSIEREDGVKAKVEIKSNYKDYFGTLKRTNTNKGVPSPFKVKMEIEPFEKTKMQVKTPAGGGYVEKTINKKTGAEKTRSAGFVKTRTCDATIVAETDQKGKGSKSAELELSIEEGGQKAKASIKYTKSADGKSKVSGTVTGEAKTPGSSGIKVSGAATISIED